MVVMLKLRLNCQLNDLAYIFDVSQPTISRIMMKWLKAMSIRLDRLIVWPHRDSLQKTMPNCFRVSFGNRVAVIMDCFEVFIERPSNLQSRTYTWSSYKHHNTILSRCFLVLQPKVLKVFTKNGMYSTIIHVISTTKSLLRDLVFHSI